MMVFDLEEDMFWTRFWYVCWMVMKSRVFMAERIVETDASRDSKRRSFADFATRSSSLESGRVLNG